MLFIIQTDDGSTIIATKHCVAREIIDNMIEDHKDFIVTSFDNTEYNSLEIKGTLPKKLKL